MHQWYEDEPFHAFWERGYRDQSVSCMGGPSMEVMEVLPLLSQGAKVLDLGCGEGRNALFLAKHGCTVTAVDHSESGIAKMMAKGKGLSLKGFVGKIEEFPLEDEYDLVMGHGVLYYLERDVWQELLHRIKESTRAGGFNIFTLFVYSEEYPVVDEIKAAQYKDSFCPNELQGFYEDWIEHRYDKYVKWDAHPGIALHYHPIEKLVSQKPYRRRVDVGVDMSLECFHAIEMGMKKEELICHAGTPHLVQESCALELWFYGRCVIYLENQKVTGRAFYETAPEALS